MTIEGAGEMIEFFHSVYDQQHCASLNVERNPSIHPSHLKTYLLVSVERESAEIT